MMSTELDWGLIFMGGVLGSGHCLGMCGGLVAACSLGGHATSSLGHWHRFLPHILYHLGRMLTYLTIGALAGWIGSLLAVSSRLTGMAGSLHLGVGLLMLLFAMEALGLVVLTGDGRGSGWLVRRLAPWLSCQSPWRTFPLGVLTGLLPCGMHWAFQAKAAATGSPLGGILVMALFVLGTVPTMLAFGYASSVLDHLGRRRLSLALGLLIGTLAIMEIKRGVVMSGWWF
ncbi:MAG: sulfite exporter TauE/SafE family protein [Magnetococcales bacterium]|nr:sulfite exporter TauE/SafE family protein [Magnetococcales bacterium]